MRSVKEEEKNAIKSKRVQTLPRIPPTQQAITQLGHHSLARAFSRSSKLTGFAHCIRGRRNWDGRPGPGGLGMDALLLIGGCRRKSWQKESQKRNSNPRLDAA